jgi:hypothetical protein
MAFFFWFFPSLSLQEAKKKAAMACALRREREIERRGETDD